MRGSIALDWRMVDSLLFTFAEWMRRCNSVRCVTRRLPRGTPVHHGGDNSRGSATTPLAKSTTYEWHASCFYEGGVERQSAAVWQLKTS